MDHISDRDLWLQQAQGILSKLIDLTPNQFFDSHLNRYHPIKSSLSQVFHSIDLPEGYFKDFLGEHKFDSEYLPEKADEIASMPVYEVICRLIVTQAADRWMEGHFSKFFDGGVITASLKKLVHEFDKLSLKLPAIKPVNTPKAVRKLRVFDMHTGGEPLRIILSGYPDLPKGTILEKRAYVRDNLDHLRKILMFEPRGHYDMYGALLVEPDLPGADLAVLFMHNEGYSTMCGHAIVALGRFAVERGMVKAVEPITRINIECPCGMVVADVEVKDGKAGRVSFESVPAFLFARDRTIDLPGYGNIRYDVSFGGAFYALADCGQFGLKFGSSPARAFIDAADALTQAVKIADPLDHPEFSDLAFLYGSILTEGDGKSAPTKNICVFADRAVDRSPTGSGVTARLAAMHAKGDIVKGEKRIFESITGSQFEGSVETITKTGRHEAITARVAGRAYFSGEATFIVEADDPLGGGFLVK